MSGTDASSLILAARQSSGKYVFEMAMGFFCDIRQWQGGLDLLPNDAALEREDCERRQDSDYRNDPHHFNQGETTVPLSRLAGLPIMESPDSPPLV